MKKAYCKYCRESHELYYLIKSNNTKALFYLCPKLKGRDQVFIVFVPLIDSLSIPVYHSGTNEYESLKRSVPVLSDFSESEKKIIDQWRKAKLFSRNMTRDQLLIIREYIAGDIKW